MTGTGRGFAPSSARGMAEHTTAETAALDAPAPQASPGGTHGVITLARHGEPALSRKIRFNGEGYREWWGRYEEGGLKAGQTPPKALVDRAAKAGAVVASTRRRSIETARAVVGERAFATDPLFIEAPLPPPPWPAWIKLSPKLWGFWSRFWWWYFNHHETQESRAEAEMRAAAAARMLGDLAANGQDVVLLAHGFFNVMIARALKAQGWRQTDNEGWRYWTTKTFVRP
jgi:broad specificity phosphatase PhoE